MFAILIFLVLFGMPIDGYSASLRDSFVVAALDDPDPTDPPPCGADCKCNFGACNDDPDCPELPPHCHLDDGPQPVVHPSADVHTPCGGTVHVRASDGVLGRAAAQVASEYPNFNSAQKAKDPHFFDAHPSGAFAQKHTELAGFGVTMVQGKWPSPVDNASGSLSDPTLLFYQKSGSNQEGWEIIGMGYFFEFESDNERPPANFPAIDAKHWWIHDAGYHNVPGDGNFRCASNDDLTNKAYDTGKRIDAKGCHGIEKSDLKTREIVLGKADQKHGRIWTVHVWFEPGKSRPTVKKTDPWCRQDQNALVMPACTFFKQGQC